MTQIEIADGGPQFSRLVAGMMNLAQWGLSNEELIAWLERALELGFTTFDHADIYGGYTCEQIFGQALQQQPSLRERMQLVTKCDIMLMSPNRPANTIKHYNTSRDHIIASAENSLRMLQTDYIDVLLIHRPDPLMDADEVAEAFNTLKDAGKVLHFGVSNFSASQFALLNSRLDFPLVTNQVELSPLNMGVMEDGTLDQCQLLRISPMIWSPFAGGRIFRADDVPRLHQTLSQIGQAHAAGVDQIALAWLLRHPGKLLPILGTGKRERLEAAVAAENIELSRHEWFSIWEAAKGHEVA